MSGVRKLLHRNHSLLPQVITKGSQQSSSITHTEVFINSYNKHYMSDGNKQGQKISKALTSTQ
jgi:hypothetical protein